MGEVISSNPKISGVEIRPLKQIGDERGMVMHMLRGDAPHFQSFGEVYFSLVHSGIVKAWKQHKAMTQNYAVPVGEILLVLYDDRQGSETRGVVQEIEVGRDKYGLVTVPPGLWYGFKGVAACDSVIVNCASIPHDPLEVENKSSDDTTIPYRW